MSALATVWLVLRGIVSGLIGLLALIIALTGAFEMLSPGLGVADPATVGALMIFGAIAGGELLIRLVVRDPPPFMLGPAVAVPLGLWLLHGVAPWELRHGEATVADIQTHGSFNNSDDTSDEAIGSMIDFASLEHTCTFRYFLHHRSRREVADALAAGDRVRFSYRDSARADLAKSVGYDCLATAPDASHAAGGPDLEISDLEKDGVPVLMRRPTRHLRGAAGAGLLAIAALVLGAALIPSRRRETLPPPPPPAMPGP